MFVHTNLLNNIYHTKGLNANIQQATYIKQDNMLQSIFQTADICDT